MRYYSSINTGLVGAWCGNVDRSSSTLVVDQGPYANHGIFLGMATTDIAIRNGYRGWRFDGNTATTDYAIRLSKTLLDTSRPFSVHCSFSPAALADGSNRYIVSKWSASTGRDGFAIQLQPFSNEVGIQIADSAGRTETLVDVTGTINSVVNIGISYDFSTLNIFRDGRLASSTAVMRVCASSASNLMIGAAYRTDTSILGAFNGAIFDARVYQRLLGADEFFRLASAPGVGLNPQRRRKYYLISSSSSLYIPQFMYSSSQLCFPGGA
jgi:hypothetical protein